ncbi:hypothetical protein KUV85_09980 [Nocardioides panacisoli]|uniref:hypothetical protein n=1 Tax=Nocardioides panacisoli TaxID=627624 RepID=UPI001C628ACB|nr:hypothetical protein [Nocardioides panacisoli]QYJ02667.1 hypothetical protein KUV85_09980 [Nocardioides panacisoli]
MQSGVDARSVAPVRRRAGIALVVVGSLLAVAALGGASWALVDAYDGARAERGPAAADVTFPVSRGSAAAGPTEEERSSARRFADLALSEIAGLERNGADRDDAAAARLMTDAYAEDYRSTVQEIRSSMPPGTVRTVLTVEETAVAGGTPDRMSVLVLANSVRVEADGDRSDPFRQWVVVDLVRDGEGWLVDDLAFDRGTQVSESDPARRAAMSRATEFATTLLNVDHRSMGRRQERLQNLVTESLGAQYEREYDDLRRRARRDGSVLDIDVEAVGVTIFLPTAAQLLVAASGTVTSNRSGERVEATYLLEVTLNIVDGEWLAAEAVLEQVT